MSTEAILGGSLAADEPRPHGNGAFELPSRISRSGRQPLRDNAVYVSNESGVWQVHTFDTETGARRQVTDHPVGLVDAVPTLDGEGVLWFQDESGDESGRWHVQPFHGGETTLFLDGVPHGWNEGLAQAPGIVVAAISDREGFAVYVSIDGGIGTGDPPRRSLGAARERRVGGIPPRGALRGRHAALPRACGARRPHPPSAPRDRSAHRRDRRRAARRGDVAGRSLLVARSRRPASRVRPRTRRRHAAGDLEPRDGRLRAAPARPRRRGLRGRLVARRLRAPARTHIHEGRSYLHRYDVATGGLTPISTEPGYIWKARVRPDGRVWFAHEQGKRQRLVLDDTGAEILTLGDARPRRGHTSRGTSRTHTGSACTASSSRRTTRAARSRC